MLSDLYWETSRNTVKIPEADFTELKSAHLRKVSLSKMKDKYPTCPRFILSLILLFRDTKSALFG